MKHFLITCILLLTTSLSTLFAQNFQLNFEETLVIGKEDSDSTEYLFSGPRTIRLLPGGDILIADASDKAIRIFDNQGHFLRKLGQRGRGPGDFLDVTSVEIGSDGKIIALDRFQNRISFFDQNEGFLNSTTLQTETLGVSQVFENPNSNEFIAVSRDFLNPEDEGYLLHRYNEELTIKLDEILNIFDSFFDESNPLHVSISQVPRYKGVQLNPYKFAIIPGIYTGTIFVLNTNTNQEQLFGEPLPQIVEEYDWEKREQFRNSDEVGFASSSGASGQFFYKQTGSNLGIVGNANFILNFYVLFDGKEIIPFVTIYSIEGEKLANINLKESPIHFIKNNRISIVPNYLDENNKLYVSDYNYNYSHPAVRVFETNFSELLEPEN